jgi:hypothetical protein
VNFESAIIACEILPEGEGRLIDHRRKVVILSATEGARAEIDRRRAGGSELSVFGDHLGAGLWVWQWRPDENGELRRMNPGEASIMAAASIEGNEKPIAVDPIRPRPFPETLDGELWGILGRPCFACANFSARLVALGLYERPGEGMRAETEQAIFIHWALGLFLRYGSEWLDKGNELLNYTEAEREVIKKAKTAGVEISFSTASEYRTELEAATAARKAELAGRRFG